MEEKRHLRLVENRSDSQPEWLIFLRAFEEIFAGTRADKRFCFTPPAQEALYALAARRLGTPRKRINQMLNLSLPQLPEEVQPETPDPAFGSLTFRASPLRLFAGLEENFAILRDNLLFWPQISLGGGGGWADSTTPHLPTMRIEIDRLPSAYGWHPQTIKRLQREILKLEGILRKMRETHSRSIELAIARGALFGEGKKSKAVVRYEEHSLEKADLLEKRRALLYDLAMAYGWRLEADLEADEFRLDAATGLSLRMAGDSPQT